MSVYWVPSWYGDSLCRCGDFRCREGIFSGCRSVRLKPEIPSFYLHVTWVCCSTRPTVTVLRHVRPSVRLSVRPSWEVSGHLPGRTFGGNSLKFYMLMYRDHLQNWLVYGHGLLIFLILALFWLSETGQIWGFGHFPENAWRKWPKIFALWCILTTFRFD